MFTVMKLITINRSFFLNSESFTFNWSALFITFIVILILCSPLKVDVAIEEMKMHKQLTVGGDFILPVRRGHFPRRLCLQDYTNTNFLTFINTARHFHIYWYFHISIIMILMRKIRRIQAAGMYKFKYKGGLVGLGGGVHSTMCHCRFDHAVIFSTMILSWTPVEEYWNSENIDLLLIAYTTLHRLKTSIKYVLFLQQATTMLQEETNNDTSVKAVAHFSTFCQHTFERHGLGKACLAHCHLVSSEKHVITQWLAARSIKIIPKWKGTPQCDSASKCVRLQCYSDWISARVICLIKTLLFREIKLIDMVFLD